MLSHFHLYEEQRSSGVMGRRNGPSGLRDDDDDGVVLVLRSTVLVMVLPLLYCSHHCQKHNVQ